MTSFFVTAGGKWLASETSFRCWISCKNQIYGFTVIQSKKLLGSIPKVVEYVTNSKILTYFAL